MKSKFFYWGVLLLIVLGGYFLFATSAEGPLFFPSNFRYDAGVGVDECVTDEDCGSQFCRYSDVDECGGIAVGVTPRCVDGSCTEDESDWTCDEKPKCVDSCNLDIGDRCKFTNEGEVFCQDKPFINCCEIDSPYQHRCVEASTENECASCQRVNDIVDADEEITV